ncbi:type I-E CRISPR-associated protein Cse2/CasB [Shigella boydii]|uniref:Type I-E CRISPR-associated protein Cse2/CasB n=1 Tax=Shigella flexneri TaxID=623 RepID=A0A3T2UQ98_SHIFL|nr:MULTISPECIES: type I-E CRISPR-associated protein Cse2/CasB [Shigella]ELX7459648.1 type I-E CRISPR-associated protein Cse2/CasB [Shigella sonnei]EAA0480554.1 type I-E CRISPR-associated protein Cse2/CasB [Shigella flexneri]EAA3321405.1 type I-E CRISPR-associated protein Cse2/CasB [Shigella flexneri]EFV7190978.1 type I-E CRISPR-associated protein Cse2/CasB [Shigella flexneri]EFV8920101.1 type I-E CRISPR-associated protein Cse2/CasB [Shigella flexneri]
MSIVKDEHKVALRKWHEELQDKRGERASLRRSTTVNDVCLTDGFRLFLKNRQIKWQDEPEWRITALALIAAVSANVKAIDERQPFAAQLAAVMKKGRFTRLLAVKTPDDLLRQLRRAVKLLNGSVNLDSLEEGVFRWCQESDDLLNHHRRQQRPTEFIRIRWALGAGRWALEYYQAGDADNEQN